MIQSFSMKLPIPPVLNNLYLNIPRKGRVLSYQGKAWKEKAGWEARQHWGDEPSKAPFAINLTVYVKHMRDVNSSDKLLLDAMQGIVYENDTQVDELHIQRYKAAKGEDGWIEVTVTQKEP